MMAAVQAQVPLIVIFIGYSCFSPYLTFLFAGGSVHGATVIVSWTLRVVKLFSVLIVLVAMTQVTISNSKIIVIFILEGETRLDYM